MKCNILCYFDFIGFDDDVYMFKRILGLNRFKPTSVTYLDEPPTQDQVSGKDLIFIDFGGMGRGSDPYNKNLRHFRKLINDNEEKTFVFALTMPTWFYGADDILQLPNVVSFSKDDYRNYNKVFELYK